MASRGRRDIKRRRRRMKDKAIEWLMGLNPFDKVKGHTKIELTDILE